MTMTMTITLKSTKTEVRFTTEPTEDAEGRGLAKTRRRQADFIVHGKLRGRGERIGEPVKRRGGESARRR